MKVPLEWAMGTIRFSTGRETTEEQIDRVIQIVTGALQRIQPCEGESKASEPATEGIKLTHYTHGLGCACKLRPQLLENVLKNLAPTSDPAILVGTETSDDACVYQLSDDLAIVQTVDFFTPIVDDPYWFGAISAANSLSDIYAMGGEPRFALSIVGFPSSRLPMSALDRILEGAQAKAAEAGISIIGGHTVDDIEPKFGLAVSGTIHPQHIIRNCTAQVGDALILTKPLGFGIITTAAKRKLATTQEIEEVIQWMAMLNEKACKAIRKTGVHACTDITGFGLLGHLHEIALGSGVDARIFAQEVPVLESAYRLAVAGCIPGGTRDNLAYATAFTDFDPAVSETTRLLLADAQTSGGLLISVAQDKKDALIKDLEKSGVSQSKVIGSITRKENGKITIGK
jgi:selenium donor protein